MATGSYMTLIYSRSQSEVQGDLLKSYKKSRWKGKGGDKTTKRRCGEGVRFKGEGFKGDRFQDEFQRRGFQIREDVHVKEEGFK
ncbi:hypothetical protein TNCV_4856581 [Trichonephila clavipes]|nr:hypothetical protein TNCV_4856581 [Trichonephila clavipes]